MARPPDGQERPRVSDVPTLHSPAPGAASRCAISRRLSFAKTLSDSFKQPEVLPWIQDYEPRGEGLPGNGHPQTIDRHGQAGFGVEEGNEKAGVGCGVRVRW